MYNVDPQVVNDLMSFCDIPAWGAGALLYNPNVYSINKQQEFLGGILDQIKPSYVLETGTESGMFDYFVKVVVPYVKVVTFGMDQSADHRATKCVDYLNNRFGNYIEYIIGDSEVTLSKFYPREAITFAWVDGGHERETPYIDLRNCARLRIPHICVDDYNEQPNVRNAVERFLKDSPQYEIIGTTDEIRGICYLNLI